MLGRALKLLDDELDKLSGDTLPGEVALKLYDTYGFLLDLTQDALRERNLAVDTDGFDAAMESSVPKRAPIERFGKETEVVWFDLHNKAQAMNLSAINRLSPKGKFSPLSKTVSR